MKSKAALFEYQTSMMLSSIQNAIVLKIEHDEMRKCSRPCLIRFHKVSKLKSPEEHYLILLQLYMPWRNENELKQGNRIYENRYKEVEGDMLCNI